MGYYNELSMDDPNEELFSYEGWGVDDRRPVTPPPPPPPPPAPIAFPSDAAMLAAFESILDQLDTERRTADPKDRAEQAYWRNQHNSFAKAFRQYRDGVRPDYTGESYLLSSATRPGAVVHRVRLVGGVWLCSCEATAFCWHAAMIATVERAIEMLEQGLLGDADPGPGGPIVVTTDGDGVQLTKGDQAIDCRTPEDVALAVRSLTARICEARARIAA